MNGLNKNRERALEFIFAVLLCLSLVCFAGIPALSQNTSDDPQYTAHELDFRLGNLIRGRYRSR